MALANNIQLNFASGELSLKVYGRSDLKLYQNGVERMENFIPETQGPARYRTGSRFVNHTKSNNVPFFIPFQFNDAQSYMLEFTDQFMRVFRDEAPVVNAADSIDGATQDNPVVISSNTHNYSNGDEVFISGVVGMTELNGKYFIVANTIPGTSYSLKDVDGVDINGTGFLAYSSGGTAESIFEIATPYLEVELPQLKVAQNADTMYIVHPNHEPRKLVRTDHNAWTLSRFARTADPFSKVITGASQANPGVIIAVGHGFSTGDLITIEDVVGMVELNGNTYTITVVDPDNFSIGVNTTGFTLYGSAGLCYVQDNMPGAVAFFEGRLFYGRQPLTLPETFWGSRAPESDGTPRYDDFTTGADVDHSVVFTIAPSQGKADVIRWLAGNTQFLTAGTFGGTSKITGSGQEEPITPGSINVKPVDALGCADISPVSLGGILLYIQRGKLIIRSYEFNILKESYDSVDRNLVADHLTIGGINQLAFQTGRPDTLWAVRSDGVLLSLTFKSKEDVSGWARQILGGGGKVLTVGVLSMPSNFDQVWVAVERTIDGNTRRYVEFFEDEPNIPQFLDFYTGDDNKAADENIFGNAMFEAQKSYVHVDSALSYNGTDPGSDASATMTPGAVTGTGITFTASAGVFVASDVGREIWKKAIDGVGEGRAEITAFVSSTEVTCTIKKDFDNINAMAAGSWYLTTDSISGLEHLEGEEVVIVTDGARHPAETVSGGAITLDFQASAIHVGLGYIGLIKTLNLEGGGINGPAQSKPRNIEKVGVRFLNTLGARFGTDRYNLEALNFRSTAHDNDRPSPLFSGIVPVTFEDSWEEEKTLYVEQISPLPCVIQFLDIFMDTTNE